MPIRKEIRQPIHHCLVGVAVLLAHPALQPRSAAAISLDGGAHPVTVPAQSMLLAQVTPRALRTALQSRPGLASALQDRLEQIRDTAPAALPSVLERVLTTGGRNGLEAVLTRLVGGGDLSPERLQRLATLLSTVLRVDGGRDAGKAALYSFQLDSLTALEGLRRQPGFGRRLSASRLSGNGTDPKQPGSGTRNVIRSFRESNLKQSFTPRKAAGALSDEEAASSFLNGEAASLAYLSQKLGLNPERYRVPSIGQLSESLRAAAAGVRERWNTPSALLSSTSSIRERLRSYNPAVLRFSVANLPGGDPADPDLQVDTILIRDSGNARAWRSIQRRSALVGALRNLYADASGDLNEPGAAPDLGILSDIMAPVASEIRQNAISTLVISADPVFLNVPFAALPTPEGPLGGQVSFSLTPSLAISNLAESASQVPGAAQRAGTTVIAGSSQFSEGLAPLLMADQEMLAIRGTAAAARVVAREEFTSRALIEAFNDPIVDRIHLVTHADTSLQGGGEAVLHTATSPLKLSDLSARVQRDPSQPLDLISISACRSSLSFTEQELGLAGAAIQLGARATIGSTWYVDDVATAALFVLLYRNLAENIPKAEALRSAQEQLQSGRVRVTGSDVIGPDGQPLLRGLSRDQQLRYRDGFSHPYFWSGVQLIGSPW
ncbi:MAG: CHAT domain-containing protein [Cyanobium sp.]